MLQLDTKITLNKDTIESRNLCDRFSEVDLNALGTWAQEGFKRDRDSRFHWEKRMDKALDIAMQITKDKTSPWPGCSNVAFPLVTIGALQLHSRTFPALINGPEVVEYKVLGDDPQGELAKHSERIAKDMNYQLIMQDTSWVEGHDKLILNIAVVGSAFKKSYRSGAKRHNVSELVMSKDLVLDYFAKSVEDCMRKTHILYLYRNEIYERVKRGMYRDILEETWYQQPPSPMPQTAEDNRTKQVQPQGDESTPFTILEMHCWLDLDDDGYAEPYILTFEEQTGCVLRLVARFEHEDDIERNSAGEIVTIRATEYFTKYELLPAPDGGIYGLGFGILLGPLNDSVSSLVNQLIDAGTMANSAGGFLGRGAKIRGGVYTFAPLEWKRLDSPVDDIQKNVFPLPVREPSPTLFQLLGLLIEYSQRITGATDMLSGENPGQNTPAQTSQTMVVQGSKIYSAIYMRIWRSMKEEFKKLFILNGRYARTTGRIANREDYLHDPDLIAPAAPPFVLTDEQALAQAIALKQAAGSTPGYNPEVVERRYLKALRIEDINNVYPGIKATGPLPNPRLQIEQLKAQTKEKDIQFQMQKFTLELMEERRINAAKILELEARAHKELAEANGVQAGHQIAAFQAAIGALKTHNDALSQRIEHMLHQQEIMNEQQSLNGAGVSGMAKPSGNAGGYGTPEAAQGGSEGAMG